MKVSERHRNGASIELDGAPVTVLKALEEWRTRQDATPREAIEQDEPRIKGTHSSFSSAERFDGNLIEQWAPGKKIPVVIGFRPNGESA